MTERPAKRQRVSEVPVFPVPSRTLDLTSFQRLQNQQRTPGKIILPRAPDVTVTAGILEVAINDGSTTTQIAAPTADVAVTLDSLGTLTVPGVSASSGSSSDTSSASGSASSSPPSSDASSSASSTLSPSDDSSASSAQSATIPPSNSTVISTSPRTVTVTATSTFHVSYDNGTFIAATSTQQESKTRSTSDNEDISTSRSNFYSSSSSGYVFGQDVTDTYTPYATATGVDYTDAGVGVTATGAGSAATNVDGSGSGSDSGNGNGNDNGSNGSSGPVLTPQQTQMVGGIVGGVAGIALVLVVLLYVLRWYRQRLKQQGRLPEQLASGHSRGGSGLIGSAAPMSESHSSFFPPAAMAAGMKKWRPGSDMTTMTNTTSTTGADSEKGFHRVSGRKIPSVLSTGGDQFGGSYGVFEKETRSHAPSHPPRHRHDLSESSYYRDADGTYVGNGRPASQSAPTTPVYPAIFSNESARRPSLANITSRRDFASNDFNSAFYRNMAAPEPDGVAVFRSSPARTPVTQSPSTSSIRLPIQAPVTMDEDIPEMPLPSPGLGLGLGHNLAQQRMPSRQSTRTTGSAKFREELA